MKIQFGKYAGTELSDVPEDYIQWLIETRRKDIALYEGELKRRQQVEEADLSIGERIVAAGYKALAKSAHPDAGGTDHAFQELGSAYEQLKVILKEVRGLTAK